jgi:hypothetical protein
LGGILGIGLGFAWITTFHTTSSEGYSGMLVFFTLIPNWHHRWRAALVSALSAHAAKQTRVQIVQIVNVFASVAPLGNQHVGPIQSSNNSNVISGSACC